MTTLFPGALDNFTDPIGTAMLGATTPKHSEHHANLNDAVEAIEATIGETGSTDPASIEKRLVDVIAAAAAAASAASVADAKAVAVDLDLVAHIATLGTAALTDATDYATAAQGATADAAAASIAALGTAAALDVGTSANNVVQLDGASKLPPVDGSQLLNLPGGGGGTSDHDLLTNLDHDTHLQYHNDARGDARYSPVAHASDTANPHTVTKAQVGLSAVDNTSDADKPVSTAQQTALDLKANLASPTFTGTVGGITAAMVGAPAGSGNSTGTNTGDSATPAETATTIGALINGATAKTTPVDADQFALMDSAASNVVKKTSWANVKTALGLGPSSYGIGNPAGFGFGVGIYQGTLPAGFSAMYGSNDPLSPNKGNYITADGSIMCWIPAFYWKWGTGSNGQAINAVRVVDVSYFASPAAAAAAGFATLRAFIDGGQTKTGVFVDKYKCSNNSGVASSLANSSPLSTHSAHNPFSGLNGSPPNIYGGALQAAKTRGAGFFCSSRAIAFALAILSYARAQTVTSTAFCKWYDPTNNFPKGCNNNALRDQNDAGVLYTSDGYANCGKTGSGVPFAKTTHNGDDSGVADLNGLMWEVTPGITSDGSNLYVLKQSIAMAGLTGGNTLATDAWGAAGLAANYDFVGPTYGALTASSTTKTFGNAAQVFSNAQSGTDWEMASLGIPLVGGVGGSNAFGNDGLYDYRPNEMCALSGGTWYGWSNAGVWALNLNTARSYSNDTVGFRTAYYP